MAGKREWELGEPEPRTNYASHTYHRVDLVSVVVFVGRGRRKLLSGSAAKEGSYLFTTSYEDGAAQLSQQSDPRHNKAQKIKI
jgi:phosphoglycolate phosphatase-like HAD superfamily hydrolase